MNKFEYKALVFDGEENNTRSRSIRPLRSTLLNRSERANSCR